MANLSGIFLIIQFLYAVLGMQLFGKVTQGDCLTNLTLSLTLALTLTKVTQGDYLTNLTLALALTLTKFSLFFTLGSLLVMSAFAVRARVGVRVRVRYRRQ